MITKSNQRVIHLNDQHDAPECMFGHREECDFKPCLSSLGKLSAREKVILNGDQPDTFSSFVFLHGLVDIREGVWKYNCSEFPTLEVNKKHSLLLISSQHR